MNYSIIYVTGAGGFIGSNLIKFLNENIKDKKIIGIHHSLENSITENKIYSDYKNIKWLMDNINISNSILVHTAAYIPGNRDDFQKKETLDKNMEIDLFIKSCFENAKKIIYFSSIAVYGYGYKELEMVKETEQIILKDYYAKAKYEGELIFKNISSSCILRMSSPYGNYKKNKNILEKIIENSYKGKKIAIYGEGRRTQDYIYIDDILDIIYKIIKENICGIYNLASGTPTSIMEILKCLESVLNKKIEIEVLEIKEENFVSIDNRELSRKLGHEYISIYDGIKKIIQGEYGCI